MTRLTILVASIIMLLIVTPSLEAANHQKFVVNVTAYTLRECKANHGVTASGKLVKVGMVAVSRDLELAGFKIGNRVAISNLGTFTIMDRTSKRKKRCIDIYMTNYNKAKKFGKKKLIAVLL